MTTKSVKRQKSSKNVADLSKDLFYAWLIKDEFIRLATDLSVLRLASHWLKTYLAHSQTVAE